MPFKLELIFFNRYLLKWQPVKFFMNFIMLNISDLLALIITPAAAF